MVKITSITILILSLLLVGCSKEHIVYIDRPLEVKVPVVERPAIKPLKRPELSVSKLTNESTPKDVAESYYNSLKELLLYTNKLEKLLEPFYKEYKNGK